MAADDQHRDRPEELPDQDSAVDTTVAGQEVEQEDAPIIVRSRRRRQRPINPAPAMGSIGRIQINFKKDIGTTYTYFKEYM